MAQEGKLASAYVSRRIFRIGAQEGGAQKAALARLRRGVGKPPGSMPDIWEYTLAELPEELLSHDGQPTRGEWAIHTALTLYALHQQGRDPQKEPMHRDGEGLGEAVGSLVKNEEDMSRVKRRFDAAVTASNLTEFAHHLRSLVQLLRDKGLALDYAQIARDLYWFQFPDRRDAVRLRWGQGFFRIQGGARDDAAQDDTNTQKEGVQDE